MSFLKGFQAKQKGVAEYLNTATYIDYFDRLKLLALSMYKWDGLPKSLDEEYLEQVLFEYGWCLGFEDNTVGILWLKAVTGGMLNYYNKPTSYNINAVGYNKNNISPDECIVIRNNILNKPTIETIELYAMRIAHIQRIFDDLD